MKIRSITYFCNPKYPLEEKVLKKAGAFLASAKSAYRAAGYEVQTVRAATIPFPRLLGGENIDKLLELTSQIAGIAQQLDIGYVSLGTALPEIPRSYELIPDAIFVSKNVFFGGVMADKTRGLDLAAIRACAEVIVQCAPVEPNGFANLQFAALANVPAGAPFFPAADHDKDKPAFLPSLAWGAGNSPDVFVHFVYAPRAEQLHQVRSVANSLKRAILANEAVCRKNISFTVMYITPPDPYADRVVEARLSLYEGALMRVSERYFQAPREDHWPATEHSPIGRELVSTH